MEIVTYKKCILFKGEKTREFKESLKSGGAKWNRTLVGWVATKNDGLKLVNEFVGTKGVIIESKLVFERRKMLESFKVAKIDKVSKVEPKKVEPKKVEPKKVESKFESKFEYAQREIKSLMNQHGLDGWGFKFNNRKACAGVCKYGLKMIELSKVYITSDKTTKEMIRNTILHEIAHALSGHKAGHGPVWKAKAIAIGCDGKRCCNAFSEYKYKMVCGKGCELGRHKITEGYKQKLENKQLRCGTHKLALKLETN
jgi:hypothetical protein